MRYQPEPHTKVVFHFRYFVYPEGYDKERDWKHPVDIKLTHPCAVYKKYKGNAQARALHRATCHTEYVTCSKCKRLPEYQEQLKKDTMRELNSVAL